MPGNWIALFRNGYLTSRKCTVSLISQRHGMENVSLSTLLALSEWNQDVINEFCSQRASNADLIYIYIYMLL